MNRVVLFGEDHHNILGLVRDFGVNGVKPLGIIVSTKSDKLFSSLSKYWEEVYCVDSEEDGIELLKNNFINKIKPTVVIASSDTAAAALDIHYDELNKNFILPGFDVGGKVFELMNKERQVKYANEIGIETIASKIMILNNDYEFSERYPVILKPVVSVEGEKADIKICYTREEEESSVHFLVSRGYQRVLRQLYLVDKSEYVLTGAVMPILHKCNFSLVKNVRQWPMFSGTGSFSEFVTSESMLTFCNQVMEKIQKSGYSGLIDIEFFKTREGKIYLNEINWRSSGRNFISLYTEVHSAYWWYCAVINKNYDNGCMIPAKAGYTMNEIADVRHCFKRNISIIKWLLDVKRTNSFAVWNFQDMEPFKAKIIGILRKVVHL